MISNYSRNSRSMRKPIPHYKHPDTALTDKQIDADNNNQWILFACNFRMNLDE